MCEGSYHASACRESGNGSENEVRRGAASLESSANTRGEVAEIRPRLCRSCWCPKCGVIWGWKVRRALTKAIRNFTAVQMWTLTVDPSLFENAAAVLEYLKSKRCVGELVRSLRKQGLLLSGQYFYVIEFHKSGVPHIHIIFDARRIDHGIVQARWHALGPETLDGSPSTLGIVRFSPRKNRFRNPEHAANYVTKYLIKHPAEGHPDWVMQIRNVRRISRCGHSKGLFASTGLKSAKTGGNGPSGDGAEASESVGVAPSGANLSTIGERVARCGQASVLLSKSQDANGKPLRRFRTNLAKPFDELVSEAGKALVGGGLEVPWSEAVRLERAFGSRDSGSERMRPRDVVGAPIEPAFAHDERMQDLHAEEQTRAVWREGWKLAVSAALGDLLGEAAEPMRHRSGEAA